MAKVVVGMSGGVDSAVTAYLLKKAGHEVIGVTLRTWVSEDGDEGRCCDIDDARSASWKIGIPYHSLNCLAEFKKEVTDPFVEDYIKGLTPNPCVICNRTVKWEKMCYMAEVLEADYVATGHYATIIKLPNGRYTVKKAVHAEKDQTYMLYRLTQEQLAKTMMPLGEYAKSDVRKIAEEAGIPVAAKKDSQEICFVPDGNYADYINENCEGEIPPEGNFVDEDGNILGKHKGIIHYTVGQRKGLGIALGYPAFVKKICADTNEVVLAKNEALFSREIMCRDLNFMSIPDLKTGEKVRAAVKIRYHHAGTAAEIEMVDEDRVKITFDEPVRAAAPGQSAVFYDENDCVVGGGIIV